MMSCNGIVCLLVVAVINSCMAVVQVSDRTLLVDGAPFLMQGVGYNPIPIGLSKFTSVFRWTPPKFWGLRHLIIRH